MRPELPLALPTWTEACARRIIAEGPRSKNRSAEAQAARAEVVKMLGLVRYITSSHDLRAILLSDTGYVILLRAQKLVRWGAADAKGSGNFWPARMMPVQALPPHQRREVCAVQRCIAIHHSHAAHPPLFGMYQVMAYRRAASCKLVSFFPDDNFTWVEERNIIPFGDPDPQQFLGRRAIGLQVRSVAHVPHDMDCTADSRRLRFWRSRSACSVPHACVRAWMFQRAGRDRASSMMLYAPGTY
jgi:hypothetical protein